MRPFPDFVFEAKQFDAEFKPFMNAASGAFGFLSADMRIELYVREAASERFMFVTT